MVQSLELQDQFRGCLLGLAYGVQLGEERDPSRCGSTQLVFAVLDSYNVRGAFNPQDIAEGLAQAARRPGVRLDGLSARAFQLLGEGYHFERASQLALLQTSRRDQQTADFLPRVLPAGLLHYYDDLRLIGESRVIAGFSHATELSKTAAVALNLALQHMLLVGIGGLLEELVVYLERRNPQVAEALAAGPAARLPKQTPAVLRVLRHALWTAVYEDTVQDGIARALHLDVDPVNTGAVAGAMLGARFGFDEMARMADGVNVQSLLETADRVYRLSQRATLPEPPQARLHPPAEE